MKRIVIGLVAGVLLTAGAATAATHYLITNVNQT